MGRQCGCTCCLHGIAWGLVRAWRVCHHEGGRLNRRFLLPWWRSRVTGPDACTRQRVSPACVPWILPRCRFAGTRSRQPCFAAAPEVGAGMSPSSSRSHRSSPISALSFSDLSRTASGVLPHWPGLCRLASHVLPDLENRGGGPDAWLLITLFIPICYGIEPDHSSDDPPTAIQ